MSPASELPSFLLVFWAVFMTRTLRTVWGGIERPGFHYGELVYCCRNLIVCLSTTNEWNWHWNLTSSHFCNNVTSCKENCPFLQIFSIAHWKHHCMTTHKQNFKAIQWVAYDLWPLIKVLLFSAKYDVCDWVFRWCENTTQMSTCVYKIIVFLSFIVKWRSYEFPNMMSHCQITIRILTDNGAMDWNVLNPESITFSDSLVTTIRCFHIYCA